MREPRQRLEDIREAIERIERYAALGRERFDHDELIQSWVVRHLHIIGEAASHLPVEVQQRAPSVPWREIVGMRHILVHNYFDVDLDVVWSVIERDLPSLKEQVEHLIRLPL